MWQDEIGSSGSIGLRTLDIFDPTGAAMGAVARSGHAFTVSDGVGSHGQVSVASLVISEPRIRVVLDAVRAEGTDAFWTVSPIRRASLGVPTPTDTSSVVAVASRGLRASGHADGSGRRITELDAWLT